MATVSDVAAFFVQRGTEAEDTGMSNLKLQKLIYYAQGYHLAMFDEPLFPEAIEAWPHGPVCPEIYHQYKHNGRGPIEDAVAVTPDAFQAPQIDLLEEVYEVFGQFSAWKLRDMTHEESPWKEHEANASEIPADALRRHFATRVS
jgi:uncharacterized phage-associated protein